MMAAVLTIDHELNENPLYEQLMLHSKGELNDHLLAVIISSWLCREGALPQNLGLSSSAFREMIATHFPGFSVSEKVRQEEVFDKNRIPEMDDLLGLFSRYRANVSKSELWISGIITAACLGSNHLWQDLGLWNRGQLTELISNNFPEMAKKNDKNMKWKKFLYKQLCNEEGIYVCRSPSCEVCTDYAICFGPEE